MRLKSDGGKKSKVGWIFWYGSSVLLAQALLNEPQILILDEPTAGLDPKERIRIRNYISSISENKIVLIATHVVSDVECIAKEILFLRGGKLLEKETPEKLVEQMDGLVGK